MIEDELARMLVRGTRGGVRKRRASSKSVRKPARKGVAKSGYIAHVKKYWRSHPNLTWKEAMIKARTSYVPKGGAMAGRKRCAGAMAGTRRRVGTRRRAGTRAGSKSLRQRASNLNSKLRDKKAISRTLKALSAIPTPLSGYATDASLVAEALGYGRRRR